MELKTLLIYNDQSLGLLGPIIMKYFFQSSDKSKTVEEDFFRKQNRIELLQSLQKIIDLYVENFIAVLEQHFREERNKTNQPNLFSLYQDINAEVAASKGEANIGISLSRLQKIANANKTTQQEATQINFEVISRHFDTLQGYTSDLSSNNGYYLFAGVRQLVTIAIATLLLIGLVSNPFSAGVMAGIVAAHCILGMINGWMFVAHDFCSAEMGGPGIVSCVFPLMPLVEIGILAHKKNRAVESVKECASKTITELEHEMATTESNLGLTL